MWQVDAPGSGGASLYRLRSSLFHPGKPPRSPTEDDDEDDWRAIHIPAPGPDHRRYTDTETLSPLSKSGCRGFCRDRSRRTFRLGAEAKQNWRGERKSVKIGAE